MELPEPTASCHSCSSGLTELVAKDGLLAGNSYICSKQAVDANHQPAYFVVSEASQINNLFACQFD